MHGGIPLHVCSLPFYRFGRKRENKSMKNRSREERGFVCFVELVGVEVNAPDSKAGSRVLDLHPGQILVR